MKLRTLALAGCVSAAFWSPAQAAVIVDDFTLEQGSFGSGLNVLSTGTQQSSTVNGIVNNDGSAVSFFSADGLTITGGGAATVAPLSGIIKALEVNFAKGWDNITFSFGGNPGIFDLVVNGSSVFAAGGNCAICTIGNGQNQFTLNGSGITNLAFTFDTGIATARQFRVEGVSNVPAVPEPGTWLLMILGLGAVGFAVRRRQTTAVRLQFA
jgi:hypothetical protein